MTLTKYSKTYKVPKRPYESERLDQELKIAGSYGLANKREIWRVVYVLSRIRRAARNLLMLEEGHHTRLFEGTALLRRLVRMGVLSEGVTTLEDVFGIKVEDFLDRRLQSLVAQRKLAKSIHQARVIIRHGHIGYGVDHPLLLLPFCAKLIRRILNN